MQRATERSLDPFWDRVGTVWGRQILNFRYFFYLKSSIFDLPGQFGGFQTLSYEKIIRFGVENIPKDALEAIF